LGSGGKSHVFSTYLLDAGKRTQSHSVRLLWLRNIAFILREGNEVRIVRETVIRKPCGPEKDKATEKFRIIHIQRHSYLATVGRSVIPFRH
jgi:hypothetical protein